MRNARLSVVGLLVFFAALGASVSARAAVVTFPTQGITATSSLGTLTLAYGPLAVQAAVTLGGAVYGGSYSGTLGRPLPLDIATFIASRCTSATRPFTVGCLTSVAIPWGVGASVLGTMLTLDIPNVRIQVDGLGISCLILLWVTAVYDATTSLMTIIAVRDVGRTGTCPIGVPRLAGRLLITPRISWILT